MTIKHLYSTFLILLLGHTFLFAKEYNIIDFGAVPDGKTLNTVAIQSAIDQAHEAGGGTVVVPAGRFLSGTILMKSGVEIHLEKKAVLLGSTNPADYLKLNRWMALVMADSVENIGITGKGTIDGQGAELALNVDSLFYAGKIDSAKYQFKERRPIAPLRPQIIEFVRCRNIDILDITIRNGASWIQTYDLCEDLVIDGITVDSDAYWNNDGMDITDCKNVRITNCNINASDDGICLKSYAVNHVGVKFCDSIYIADCTVRSSASAVKFGTASYSGFRNVVVENIKVYDTFRSAIALEMIDGGTLENVLVQNIKAKNTGNAIFIRLGRKYQAVPTGKLRNVTIRNMKVKVPFTAPDADYEIRGPALPFFHNIFPSSIVGLPGHPVENVTLENIQITYPGKGNKAYANLPLSRIEDIPELERSYPEFSMFGELPAWGFYVRHVDGLTMKGIKIRIKNPDYRRAMVFDDVKNLKIEELEVQGDNKPENIYLNDSEGAEIKE